VRPANIASRGKMTNKTLIAHAQTRLDDARRQLRGAAMDFDVPDEQLLELRASARRAYEELREMDRRMLKKGLLQSLKFW
jgi:hypothetical protein